MHVLFLCAGDCARCVMAEAIMNRLGGGRFIASCAGTRAGRKVDPGALRLLRDKGHDVSGLSAKSVDTFTSSDAPAFDFVISVGGEAAGEASPPVPGSPARLDWVVPEPKTSASEASRAFEEAYAALKEQIEKFLGDMNQER